MIVIRKLDKYFDVTITVDGVKSVFEIEPCYWEDIKRVYRKGEYGPEFHSQRYIKLLLVIRDKNGAVKDLKQVYKKEIKGTKRTADFYISQWANLKILHTRKAMGRGD